MKLLLTLRPVTFTAFLAFAAIAHATTYTPTMLTDPPVSGGANPAGGAGIAQDYSSNHDSTQSFPS